MNMTFISVSNTRLFVAFCAGIVFLLPFVTLAQGSVSLSISPTLFEMNANPTQEWTSTVRIINPNPFPITLYTDAVNFEPSGESGQGTMRPVFDEVSDGLTLAEWISLSVDEVEVPAEQTVTVPFSILVPEDAVPGGHFAAIMVGTKPFESQTGQSQVQTSQVVTSLVFLTVAGDIVESAQIRDFTTDSYFNETPEASFSLRFENLGNVHLQPQGDISIKNMWGKERGLIPINKTTQFGNVLPESIRNYTFEWSGDWSFSDIGRYTAEATLAYGSDQRQFVSRDTAFWVIPWKTLLVIFLILATLLTCIAWGIKLYIRSMLQMAGVTPELQRATKQRRVVSITAPLEEGMLDLRSKFASKDEGLSHGLMYAVRKYKIFFLVSGAVLILVALFVWFLASALSSERGFEVLYEQNGELVPVPGTEQESKDAERADVSPDELDITVVNRSGNSDLEIQTLAILNGAGYSVTVGEPELKTEDSATVIVYHPDLTTQALSLQELLPQALLSSFVPVDGSADQITIYLGSQ